MTHWLVRLIPAATLTVTAALLAVVGVLLPYGDAANNGPGSGQIRPGMVAFGAALILCGAALTWLAWGVWRGRKWPTRLSLVLSVSVLACLVWVTVQPATLIGSVLDPTTGQLVPQYDAGGQRLAVAIVPYAGAVVCLVAAELRARTRTD